MLSTEFSFPVSVEVSIADVMQGIFEIEGLLSYADELLTIEYQSNELFSRATRIDSVELSLDSLREVVFKRKVTGARITLRPKRLSTFEDVQISTNAQILLKVKRADRKEAEALVSHLQRVMSYRSTPGDVSLIPFRISDVGLREIKGHLYLEDDEFIVFDVENSLVGEFDTRRQLIKVAPRALKEVELTEKRFRDRLHIRPNSRELLETMPGSHKFELELKIHRKHRDEVARLLYELDRLKRRSSAPDDGPTGEQSGRPEHVDEKREEGHGD